MTCSKKIYMRNGSRSNEFPRPFSWQLPGSRGSLCAVQSVFSVPGCPEPWSGPLCGPDVRVCVDVRVGVLDVFRPDEVRVGDNWIYLRFSNLVPKFEPAKRAKPQRRRRRKR